MSNSQIQDSLLKEIKELADKKYNSQLSYVALWGSASALLTVKQLQIIKSVMEK